tara:strand:+ start:533 stop:1171 length:639 start_codon:yes stop_codon:yes gene_type:complete
MHLNKRIIKRHVTEIAYYRKKYKKLLKKLRRNCRDLPSTYKTSDRISNTLQKLDNLKASGEISNTKYNTETIVWRAVEQTLFDELELILEGLKQEEDINPSSYRYKARFDINIADLPYIKGYDKLKKLGFYNRKNNPNGVVKDHRFSIKSGIVLEIPPEYLGNLSNCEFLTEKENLVKSSNNSISFEEFCDLTGFAQDRGLCTAKRKLSERG